MFYGNKFPGRTKSASFLWTSILLLICIPYKCKGYKVLPFSFRLICQPLPDSDCLCICSRFLPVPAVCQHGLFTFITAAARLFLTFSLTLDETAFLINSSCSVSHHDWFDIWTETLPSAGNVWDGHSYRFAADDRSFCCDVKCFCSSAVKLAPHGHNDELISNKQI